MVKLPKERVSLLVSLSDSRAAGNCDFGSREYVKRIGLPADTILAGLPVILKHPDPRALAAAKVAAKNLREEIESQALLRWELEVEW
jgi:hypothetical protein